MGISDGLTPPGGDDSRPRRITINFTPETDILTGKESRAVNFVLKERRDALVGQSDAITNFKEKKGDRIYLPGVSGNLRRSSLTLRENQVDSLDEPGATDFLAPNKVAAIRIRENSGRDILGTVIISNDSRKGIQNRGDAVFFVTGLDISRADPFRYFDAFSL